MRKKHDVQALSSFQIRSSEILFLLVGAKEFQYIQVTSIFIARFLRNSIWRVCTYCWSLEHFRDS